ncbi:MULTISPECIES: hypothetical protein [Pseudoalteromonas]|uniref:Class I lanthipeptide n=1 Tax=Pseudoalteromonas luteoviolacea H33 TaxID=1365251 RepID=A0A167F6Q3_9GAMM|nr:MULTISPECIES: hypothetical protein [Pseudoalteromonas]KZN51765.1 hypothetical protein N476_12030 [Pseudoalteromonas luteoviolacea H33]KZN72770.1 hypothetical protein N477_24570 [Pseudoalteromonas luteoviolacea H33-S]MDK1286250.1 hypothetical protein [Pseudoalteromonas sp. B95]
MLLKLSKKKVKNLSASKKSLNNQQTPQVGGGQTFETIGCLPTVKCQVSWQCYSDDC